MMTPSRTRFPTRRSVHSHRSTFPASHNRNSVNMFSKLFAIASLALLAAATPTPGGSHEGGGSSATLCCASVKSYNDAKNEGLLGLINIGVEDIGKNIGLDCNV